MIRKPKPIEKAAEEVVAAAERVAESAGYDAEEGVSNILLTAVVYHAAKHIEDPDALVGQMQAAAGSLQDMASIAAFMLHRRPSH